MTKIRGRQANQAPRGEQKALRSMWATAKPGRSTPLDEGPDVAAIEKRLGKLTKLEVVEDPRLQAFSTPVTAETLRTPTES